ncbi:MAG: methyltransferase domain-containing protein [Chloroflexi bacterium]|nr:methyltransferase domain-containing protein [Chloroflexota bacterium]
MPFLSSYPKIEGVHHLGGGERFAGLQQVYLRVREMEGRLYDDEVVRRLPLVSTDDPHADEWIMRADSAQRLRAYLEQREGVVDVLDLGCGNGWLTRWLADAVKGAVLGMDINLVELEQAARVFGARENLAFAYGDVFEDALPDAGFDIVIMAASLQYFADAARLIRRLLRLLRPQGEIHILDTPFYDERSVDAARARTQAYYARLGAPEMASFYHHHRWSDLSSFAPALLYDPTRLAPRLRRSLLNQPVSPFPWLRIVQVDA